MAKLTALPAQHIIDSLAGVLDFYEWRGIPCVRMWPHWPKREKTPEEKATQDAFAYINRLAATLPLDVRNAYAAQVHGTPYTWKDLLVMSYISGITY